MSEYRLFGAETSPYSMKVKAFLKYKGVEFDWIGRSSETEEEFAAQAKVPSVPLLISPKHAPNQDSTDIIATLEADHGEPSCVPDDTAASALALVLEDYGDEWLNKAMFAMRWAGKKTDREGAAQRIMEQLYSGNLPRTKKKTRDQIAVRMGDRLNLVGADKDNLKLLQASFQRFAGLLNTHLEKHLFIFGGRPSAADFALSAQLSQMLLDPTPAKWLREKAPFVTAWCEFMEAPQPGGDFKPLAELEETLLPIFKDEIAVTYLPWSRANMKAVDDGDDKVSLTLDGQAYEQITQHYAAGAFLSIVKAFRSMMDAKGLKEFLKASNCEDLFEL